MSELFDPKGRTWYLKDDTIDFCGKTGIGDVMLGLNTAYYASSQLKKK